MTSAHLKSSETTATRPAHATRALVTTDAQEAVCVVVLQDSRARIVANARQISTALIATRPALVTTEPVMKAELVAELAPARTVSPV